MSGNITLHGDEYMSRNHRIIWRLVNKIEKHRKLTVPPETSLSVKQPEYRNRMKGNQRRGQLPWSTLCRWIGWKSGALSAISVITRCVSFRLIGSRCRHNTEQLRLVCRAKQASVLTCALLQSLAECTPIELFTPAHLLPKMEP